MADIKIEKKDKNNKHPWLWVLALLLIGGLIWWIAADDEEQMTAYNPAETEQVGQIEEQRVSDEYLANEVENTTAVREYVEFVEKREEEEGPDFNLNHSFTSEGISKLQNALAVLAREKTDMGREIRDEMNALEGYAQEIQTDPESLQHADKIQQAFNSAAKIMQMIQEESGSADVSNVMNKASDVSPEAPALEQKSAIKEFFVAASEAVKQMSDEVGEGENANVENY